MPKAKAKGKTGESVNKDGESDRSSSKGGRKVERDDPVAPSNGKQSRKGWKVNETKSEQINREDI